MARHSHTFWLEDTDSRRHALQRWLEDLANRAGATLITLGLYSSAKLQPGLRRRLGCSPSPASTPSTPAPHNNVGADSPAPA